MKINFRIFAELTWQLNYLFILESVLGHYFDLPNQNHLVNYTSNTDAEKCKQILQFLDQTLGTPPTDINISTVADKTKADSRKVMQDGKIYILRNNKKYTITGVETD